MKIETMEQFAALEEGTVIEYPTGETWTKFSTGWQMPGRDTWVPDQAFDPAITAGVLSTADGKVGRWVRYSGSESWYCAGVAPLNTTQYLVLRVNPAGTQMIVDDLYSVDSSYMDRAGIPGPDNKDILVRLAKALYAAKTGTQTFDSALKDDLHRTADWINSLSSSKGREFDAMLTSHGVGREAPHVILAKITGKTKIAAPVLPGVRVMSTSGEVEVSWSTEETFIIQGLGCTCDRVTRTEIASRIPADSVDVTWSVSHAA